MINMMDLCFVNVKRNEFFIMLRIKAFGGIRIAEMFKRFTR